MRRLLPDPGPTSVREQLEGIRLTGEAHEDRPYLYTNFAVTVDGRATISGRSGAIGSDLDTEMLMGLRAEADAVMIGAGTLRVERYGRMIPDAASRARRERVGLPHDPLAVVISGRLDLPWDAPLFTEGAGRVLVFTNSDAEPPDTATSLRIVRQDGDRVDLTAAMRYLRRERGIRALLCEGGPTVQAELLATGLVDEMFITVAPKLVGQGRAMVEGALGETRELELAWLLEADGELFTRYRLPGGE